MFAGIRRWVKDSRKEPPQVRSAGLPLLEHLEPRLLLSADSLASAPLVPLETALAGQALYVDLSRQDQEPEESDSSVVATFPVSGDETDPQFSSEAAMAVSEEEGSSEPLLGPIAVPVGTDLDEARLSTVGSPGQAQCSVEVAADFEESAAVFSEPSAGLIPGDGQGDIFRTEGFPIEARGPPAQPQAEALLAAGPSAESDATDVSGTTQRAFIFDMSAGYNHVFLRLHTADGAGILQITDAAGTILSEASLLSTGVIAIYGQHHVDDTLTVDLSAAIPIPIYYHGGDGGFDTLVIIRGKPPALPGDS